MEYLLYVFAVDSSNSLGNQLCRHPLLVAVLDAEEAVDRERGRILIYGRMVGGTEK